MENKLANLDEEKVYKIMILLTRIFFILEFAGAVVPSIKTGILSVVGNFDNGFLIVFLPLIILHIFRNRIPLIKNKNQESLKLIRILICIFTLISIYMIFDVEMDMLPLLQMGTADLADIPVGIAGSLTGFIGAQAIVKVLFFDT